jgi:hypothetical protein
MTRGHDLTALVVGPATRLLHAEPDGVQLRTTAADASDTTYRAFDGALLSVATV